MSQTWTSSERHALTKHRYEASVCERQRQPQREWFTETSQWKQPPCENQPHIGTNSRSEPTLIGTNLYQNQLPIGTNLHRNRPMRNKLSEVPVSVQYRCSDGFSGRGCESGGGLSKWLQQVEDLLSSFSSSMEPRRKISSDSSAIRRSERD